MKIALFGRSIIDEDITAIRTLIADILNFGHRLTVYRSFYDKLSGDLSFPSSITTFSDPLTSKSQCDMLFSVGGDGTLLNSLSVLGNSEIPVLGINTGHLGFLTGVNRSCIDGLIENITQQRFHVESRTVLRIDSADGFFGNENYALNEVSLQCGSRKEIISIDIFVDDVFMATCSADGVLIATPTGSTAYSLSCGGPILQPDAACFVIVPINAHTLTFRPMVVPDSSTIRLVAKEANEDIVITADATHVIAKPKTEIVLYKEDFCVNLVRLNQQDFYAAIREKLIWGKDLRHKETNSGDTSFPNEKNTLSLNH